MTTREEHLKWCKNRALEYIDDDHAGALASFISDMNKHEETQKQMDVCGFMIMFCNTKDSVLRFIEGFN